ncbi:unnamed protein product [Calicophoron daubneyi]|uniref:Uncharacterized protein n=1 Tax=Calicophoron daubneyi TaxID=300641 RepID=A0AAV2SZ23_CALDB
MIALRQVVPTHKIIPHKQIRSGFRQTTESCDTGTVSRSRRTVDMVSSLRIISVLLRRSTDIQTLVSGLQTTTGSIRHPQDPPHWRLLRTRGIKDLFGIIQPTVLSRLHRVPEEGS